MAKISPSTITRFMNNPGYKFTPSTSTLEKIAKATGISPAPFFEAKDYASSSLLPFESKTLYDESWAIEDIKLESTLVIGAVAPGVWKEAGLLGISQSAPISIMPSVHGAKPSDFFAVRVEGDSVDRIAQSGDFLICQRINSLKQPLESGSFVIVERRLKALPLLELTARVTTIVDGQWHLRFPTTDDALYKHVLKEDDVQSPTEVSVTGKVLFVYKCIPTNAELIGYFG